MITLSIYF